MTPQELYEKYKGKKVIDDLNDLVVEGIIVGYTNNRIDYKLIMSVTYDPYHLSWDFTYLDDELDFIFNNFRHPGGYWYTNESCVVKLKFGR